MMDRNMEVRESGADRRKCEVNKGGKSPDGEDTKGRKRKHK